MGADGGFSGSLSRSNVASSSDVSQLPQYLSFEPISLGNQKYMRSGELRRALGFPLVNASEDHMFRASSLKPTTPIATEDLKQFKDNVVNASYKARERSNIFRNSISKLDKYTETMGLRKRQRADLVSVEKPGGSNLLRTTVQSARNLLDPSTRRLDDRATYGGMSKRFRSSAAEPRVDCKSGLSSKDLMINEDTNINNLASGAADQPEERSLRRSAVGEGWDKNMKRKRSVGAVANRLTDNDTKKAMQPKLSTETKLAPCDSSASRSIVKQSTSSGSPGTIIKAKIARAPRTGSLMAVNSSDCQASSEASAGLEQPTTSTKVISLGSMQKHHRAVNSSQMLGQWVGQRQQKSSRSRRTHVLPPVSNHDEVKGAPLNPTTPVSVKAALNVNSGCLDSVDVHKSVPKIKIENGSTPSPSRLSAGEEIIGLDFTVEERGKGISEVAALNGKGKVRAFVIPTKRNKLNENVVDGVRKQGRTVRGFSLSRPGVSPSDAKLDNVSTNKRIQNTRNASEKIRSNSGRPPSKKMSEGRVSRNESDDDHEELLAAATFARKATFLACSGKFWKKMEPVFGVVSSQDKLYLKNQLGSAEELEDSQSVISSAGNNLLGVVMCKERGDGAFGKKGSESVQVVDKIDRLHVGLSGERRSDKLSSLYQRVLSALIEEDDNEGCYNGYEGVSMSFQCASEDSHCGSCNYADTETRDRERFDSEAESRVDFQIQKRYSGDRFSCTKSVTSNTTWNTSMSDSLYSSGRWLGDDGVCYSDAEFISGSCQNDLGGPQSVDITATGAFSDCQYQLMCVDDKLMLELQSIGLFPDSVPDLAEGEVIDRDLTELKEILYDQLGKKKGNLVKIDRAIQDDSGKELRFMEQVAMEQLIQMASQRKMASRRHNASKTVTVMRKVSKHVAMGFIERTLARCKDFEDTGRSCFSEPALRSVMFASSQGNDAGVNVTTDGRIGRVAQHVNSAKTDSGSPSMPGSCIDDPVRGFTDSPQAACHSFDHGFAEIIPVSDKGKKRELLLEDIGGIPSRATVAYDIPPTGGQRKRNEKVNDYKMATLIPDTVRGNQSVEGSRGVEKPKAKIKQSSASVVHPLSSPNQQQNTVNDNSGDLWPSSSGKESKDASEDAEAFDPMVAVDVDNFFDCEIDMQDDDFAGLSIPMDDLFSVI